jgi:signal transduction histidine kinase
VVTRYSLARPIHELLDGAVAVGRGDLNYRVRVQSSSGELASLAQEFNRMADRLAEQRRATLREAEERLGLERRLRHSEQLATVGKVAAGVAHEIGAPLQVIDGRAKQLLHHSDATIETRQRNLTIIRKQAERIARIVRQLLNLSRPHKLHFRKMELAPLIFETVELIETQAESAAVEIEIPRGDDVRIEADAELIQQVLLNIFRNGIQAMPQGGRLRIEWLKDAAERSGRSFAALRVSDTGVGIAPDCLPYLFDPFFTTKEVGQGTGLGLPISIRIVEEHDGWIEAANRAEGGAVFTVYLPQADPIEEAPEAAPEAVAAEVTEGGVA